MPIVSQRYADVTAATGFGRFELQIVAPESLKVIIKVFCEVDINLREGYSVADHVVTAHELGHLVGLPDEYLDYSSFQNETINRSQPYWDQLCNGHLPPIPRRRWNSHFNDSIMSVGTRVYPAHAVTIWSALEESSHEDWHIAAL